MALNTQRLAHGTLFRVRLHSSLNGRGSCQGQVGSNWSLAWAFWFGVGFEWRFIEHTVYLADMAETVE